MSLVVCPNLTICSRHFQSFAPFFRHHFRANSHRSALHGRSAALVWYHINVNAESKKTTHGKQFPFSVALRFYTTISSFSPSSIMQLLYPTCESVCVLVGYISCPLPPLRPVLVAFVCLRQTPVRLDATHALIWSCRIDRLLPCRQS